MIGHKGRTTYLKHHIERTFDEQSRMSFKAAIRVNCGDQLIMAGAVSALYLPDTCDLNLPQSIFETSAVTLRERPDLLMDLRHQLSDLDAKLQNLRQVDTQLDDLLGLAEIEQSN